MEAWKTNIETGERVKVIKHGNCTIVLHRPELPEAVRRKREEAVSIALASFAKNQHNEVTA